MTAEIYTLNNGKALMAYVGEKPWHGLGQILTPDSPIEVWKIEAGLNWSIEEAVIEARINDAITYKVADKKALYRSDNNEHLAVVGDGFKVVQPEEILELYRDLVSDFGFQLETAGSLKGGRTIWALAKTPMNFKIGNDEINGYLLLATANDGTMSTTAKFTSVRVVCSNTMQVSLREGTTHSVKVSHRSEFKDNTVKSELGLLSSEWSEFGDIITAMSDYNMNREEVAENLFYLFADKEETIDSMSTRKQNIIKEVWSCITTSPGSNMGSAAGKAWGFLNGVTYYVDHKANARSDDNRINSAWFGNGEKLKNKAFNAMLKLVA